MNESFSSSVIFSMPMPLAARISAITGTGKFRIAKGAYSQAATPSTPYIWTPHVLHGMETDVSVPPYSRERERFVECRFFAIYVRRNMREGTTIEMYCSEHVAFVVKAAIIVEVTTPKVPLATLMICVMMD